MRAFIPIVSVAALALAPLEANALAIVAAPVVPIPFPVYPGCPVPVVGPWVNTPGVQATNHVWYVNPVGGNNANDGTTPATAWHDISALTTAGVVGGGGSNPHALLVSVDPVNGFVKGGDEVLLETGAYGAVSISPAAQATNSPEVTLAADAGATPDFTRLTISKTSGWVIKGLTIQETAFPVVSAAIVTNSTTANPVNDIIFVGNSVSNHTTAAFNAFVANFQGT